MKHLSTPEPLETRIALSGAAIAKALGVPAGGSVFDYSQAAAIGVGSNFGVEGLIGFPTGPDDQFVILSTGDATKFNTPGYPSHGTDWTSKGPIADDVSVFVTVPVPVGATRLKLDFVFLTQEHYDNFDGLGFVNEYEDFFKITANAGMGGGDETIVDYNVDNVFYMPGADAGPNFKTRTLLVTMNYPVPAGATSISLNMELGDDLDGTGDTAVIMDNLRFEQSQNVVFLNFEGGTTSALGPGTTLTMPAFQVSDLGYSGGTDRAMIINEIVTEVEAKYAAFDVSFVTTQPVAGDYTTVMIGGNQNNPVTLNPATANPLLVKQYGAGTTFATITKLDPGSTLFGQALGGVDVGNTRLSDVTVVFPQSFTNAYSEPAATREDRMVVTIAHELGHALGLRHIQAQAVDPNNDPNIMKQKSPRSSAAGFEDVTRPLATNELNFWTDKATELNVAGYLRTVLGSVTGSSVDLGFSPLSFNKWVTGLFSALFGGTLYNAYLGVIPGQPLDSAQDGAEDGFEDAEISATPVMFKVGDLNNEFLKIPVTSTTDKLIFWGQSTPGGPVDVFSGLHSGGTLNFEDSGVPLFDLNGNLVTSIPTSFGDPNVGLTNGPVLGLLPSEFRIPLLPFGTYEDAPPVGSMNGDSYTIKLTTKTGKGGFSMLDPDGDGKGPIDQIVVQDTTIKDKLSITVQKPASNLLDGLVNIGAIRGSTLGSVEAKASDLTGAGIDFGNLLGKLTVRDVRNGADISIGGGEFLKTKITAHVIADGTDIVSRSTIDSLTAAAIGDGKIDAPGIGKLKVTGDKKAAIPIAGDFHSDIKLEHSTPFLTQALIKKNMLGSATIAGTTQGATIDIDGPVGKFKTARFLNSTLDVQSFFAAAKLGSFTATGIKDSPLPAFDNSHIIANIIGSVKLGTIDSVNVGPFGVTAAGFGIDLGVIGSVSGVFLPSGTTFKYDKTNPNPQGLDQFVVKVT